MWHGGIAMLLKWLESSSRGKQFPLKQKRVWLTLLDAGGGRGVENEISEGENEKS